MSDTSSTASSIVSGTSTPNTTPFSTSPTASSIITFVDLKPCRTLIPKQWREQSVRRVAPGEIREAAVSLSQAFAADDLAQYLLPEETNDLTKWKLHIDIMTYIVAAHCYSGLVMTSGLDYEGVALWMPPGKTMDDWWTIMRSGMWKLYYQLSSEGRRRYYDEMLPLLHRTKQEIMGDRDDDCYYLVYIGTKPRCRGQGYGKRLINDMLDKADAENRAVYLESSNIINNGYYRQFGFEEKREVYLERGSEPVLLTIMVREPGTWGPMRTSGPVPRLSAPLTRHLQHSHHHHQHHHHHYHLDPHVLKQKLFGKRV
ncbi:putative gcn5-related n-acetyltransferase-like protein [Zalerion maritima]|uniref:Gcn5-related n-acetyltransferase-like protein n=1 Tax=Zalerion maritima TaxID=339359 RepID=A0AAD5RG06_9PEZI|nr:putative gcn5-related n-acetyltransferase-like protein [Zalerion maritima]